MSKRTLALVVVLLAFVPRAASAGTITFSSGLSSPALRVTFDPQPEPPGITAGPTAILALSTPVDAIWISLFAGGTPLSIVGYEPLLDAAGGPLFGVRTNYDGFVLDVLFDPQPEPPGKWALVGFDPQPEPPGRFVVGVGPDGFPAGFDAFISGFDPQPEPPGIGDRGFYWFYEGSIIQGQFDGASFTLKTADGTPLVLTPVPEPTSTLALLGGALLALAHLRRKLTK